MTFAGIILYSKALTSLSLITGNKNSKLIENPKRKSTFDNDITLKDQKSIEDEYYSSDYNLLDTAEWCADNYVKKQSIL